MTEVELVAAGLIFVLAAFAQATTGFGFALVAIPLLVLFIEPEQAIVTVTAAGAALTGGAALRHRADVKRKVAFRYIWTGLLGIPFGLVVLLAVNESVLTGLIGVVVLAAVLAMLLRFRASGPQWQFGAGVLGGALLSSTGMNGPPIVIGLDGLRLSSKQFRATTQVIFVVQDIAALLFFALAGLVTGQTLALWVVSLVALPIGWSLGGLVFDRLNPVRFRAGMLAMLTASACVALGSALTNH
ncbi:sulfite exporter TauE/SafE family protein [Aeromicrobium sp. A1-2]|uniref:sulfite exporter TauE/SafE family protein n=1 Tax=Aeromicrobium sp. A1-2 TaxID=2107713 RepID=UPI0013C2AC9A|nr:sulfite exporter TauE/SafE family protein [Aeromicrobium sp. A1-2]